MGAHDRRRKLERLAALSEPVRRDLYLFVERSEIAVSRDEAAAALWIGRSLAAFHLDKLLEAGLLATHYRRLSGRAGRGAGRPAKLYQASRRPLQLSLPQREFELLGDLLAAGLESEGGLDRHAAIPTAAREHGLRLGERARRRLRGRSTALRLAQCVERVLDGLGFQPALATDSRGSHLEMRLTNCPFRPLSTQHTGIVCHTNLAFVGGIVEGVAADELRAERLEQQTNCCVLVRGSPAARA